MSHVESQGHCMKCTLPVSVVLTCSICRHRLCERCCSPINKAGGQSDVCAQCAMTNAEQLEGGLQTEDSNDEIYQLSSSTSEEKLTVSNSENALGRENAGQAPLLAADDATSVGSEGQDDDPVVPPAPAMDVSQLTAPVAPSSLPTLVSVFMCIATLYFQGRNDIIQTDPEGLILDMEELIDRFPGTAELDFIGKWMHDRELELVDIVTQSSIELTLLLFTEDLVAYHARQAR